MNLPYRLFCKPERIMIHKFLTIMIKQKLEATFIKIIIQKKMGFSFIIPLAKALSKIKDLE